MGSLLNKMKLEEGEILIREGLFTFPSSLEDKPHIIASKCKKCGDLSVPSKVFCGKCDGTDMEQVLLSSRGKIYAFTIVRKALPGYELPSIVAMVKVPEDDSLMIISQIRGCEIEDMKTGMEVETIVTELYTTLGGKKVIGYAFKPVKEGE